MSKAESIAASASVPEKLVIPWGRIGVVAGLIALVLLACFTGARPTSISESGVIMKLPNSVGRFWGTDQDVSESEHAILPKDTKFAKKVYQDGLGDTISAQIVLAGAEKRSIHRPEACLPGQGWTLKSGKAIPITLTSGKTISVMMMNISRPVTVGNGQQKELRSLFLYWFIGKDTTTPYQAMRVLKTDLDMLLHNTNHRWAYVIVSAPILEGFAPGGKNSEQTLDMLKKFIAELMPQVMKSEGAKGD